MYLLCCLVVLSASCLSTDDQTSDRSPRKFKMNYGATIADVPENAQVRIWIPIPESDQLQSIREMDSTLPTPLQRKRDKKHNNAIGYFEATGTSGSPGIDFQVTYEIERKEAKPGSLPQKLTDLEKQTYLAANKLVPTTGEPIKLLDNKELSDGPMELGQELYNIVEAYMSYDKSKSGYGNGDVLWACSSKTGNCTDFHSLFISLARNQNIPARFEIGFPISEQPSGKMGGYHCWAWFYTQSKGWIGVDISEADKHPEMKEYFFGRLTPDRVAFSTGRDIELVPASKAGPLNYFIYPHVEVDDQVWPKEKIKLNLSYTNIK